MDAANLIIRVLKAYPLDKNDQYHQRLANIIEEVGIATGGRKYECMVLPISGMNAFSVADFGGRTIIGVTEGLLSRLNRAQIEAVVAHEVAHIVSKDTLIKSVAASLFSVFGFVMAQLKKVISRGNCGTTSYNSKNRGSGVLVIFVLYLVASILYFFSKMISMFISRQCEYRADAVAIRLVRDPLSLAQSLYRISRGWRGGGEIYDCMESLFIINPNYSVLDETNGFFANLFSTHPPVFKRINCMLDMAHSNLNVLIKEVSSSETVIRPQEISIVAVNEPKWYVEDSGKWAGPYAAEQLLGLAQLNHDTFIRRQGSDKINLVYQENDLLDLLKQKENKSVKGNHRCPRDNQLLSAVVYEGVLIQMCGLCKGTLVEGNKIPRILVRQDQGFSEELISRANVIKKKSSGLTFPIAPKMQGEFNCPKCDRKMLRNFYTLAYFIEVDRCYDCDLTWFDRDELEILQYWVETAQIENDQGRL
jgi:heat shock protein HtpX